ncbi:hypothetical protein [Rhodovulum adriaticum]|uniref:hypothetical protein n=1 Tax=Rhodovulum adriaticum TaxID=35804 RepID=UPI001050AFBD|nr:hypothetical protein [Rhodovulum adriaticum]
MMKTISSAFLAFLVAGCADPTRNNGDLTACNEQTTDRGKYGAAFTASGFARLPQNLGPCVGMIIEADVRDIVRPPRATYTFQDLSTGSISTVRWIHNEIVSVASES